MGKNKKDKNNSFTKAIKEHADKIRISVGGDTENVKNLKECVEESVEGITATTIDGILPISVTEAAENAINDLPYMAVSTHYAEAVFSMYEFCIKSTSRKQTLIIPLTLDAAEDLMESERLISVIDSLKKNTDALLVLEKMPKKILKSLKEWAKDDSASKTFVIRIPDLHMFTTSIEKKTVTKALLFDLVLVFSNATKKSLGKARKNAPEKLDEFSNGLVKDLVEITENFGVSSLHVPLWTEFYSNPYVAAKAWADALADHKMPVLKKLTFSTPDPTYLISFNQEISRLINESDGSGIRVI